ncbi:hypothetical protein E5P32_12655, partial [Escherichia coli]
MRQVLLFTIFRPNTTACATSCSNERIITTRELQRWRLILGEAAETTLCGLDDNARQIDHA